MTGVCDVDRALGVLAVVCVHCLMYSESHLCCSVLQCVLQWSVLQCVLQLSVLQCVLQR